jgi:hypothetical protein
MMEIYHVRRGWWRDNAKRLVGLVAAVVLRALITEKSGQKKDVSMEKMDAMRRRSGRLAGCWLVMDGPLGFAPSVPPPVQGGQPAFPLRKESRPAGWRAARCAKIARQATRRCDRVARRAISRGGQFKLRSVCPSFSFILYLSSFSLRPIPDEREGERGKKKAG